MDMQQISETGALEMANPTQEVNLRVVARDITTLGTGTLFAAIFGTLAVFLIPRLVSVEDFGYYRLFVLYGGYAGLLHLGFDDGALLRWAGRPLSGFHHELNTSVKFLALLQVAILAAGTVLALILFRGNSLYVAIAVLVFAGVYNLSILLQFGLQAARQFRPVAVASAAPAAIFVSLALMWTEYRSPDFRALMAFYVLSWTGVFIFLWRTVKPLAATSRASLWRTGAALIGIGWPVLLANTGYNLVQTADRLAVSVAMPIYQFAQYSLAGSAMFVPAAAIASISRAVFPHLAAAERESHRKTYKQASKLILITWSLVLPYYIILDVFVRHALPKYVPGLPPAEVLLLGILFLGGIQIMHGNFFNLYGLQRRFLLHSAVAVGFALLVTGACAALLHSLTAVAIAQVCVTAIWWLANERKLRWISGQTWQDWLRILGLFVWSGLSLFGSLALTSNPAIRTLIYYLLTVVVLAFACPSEMFLCWQLLRSAKFRRNTDRIA
jgi:O-antigen/teichoic acid export membrane protein